MSENSKRLADYQDLSSCKEFTVTCLLNDNLEEKITFVKKPIYNDPLNFYVKGNFFGDTNEYKIRNDFEVLLHICLGAPFTIGFADHYSSHSNPIIFTPKSLDDITHWPPESEL